MTMRGPAAYIRSRKASLRLNFGNVSAWDVNTGTGETSPEREIHAIRVTGTGRTHPDIPPRVRYLRVTWPVRGYAAGAVLCAAGCSALPALGSWATRAGRATF